MKIIPFYFFIVLFIGFLLIYINSDGYHVIVKNKNDKCVGDKCQIA